MAITDRFFAFDNNAGVSDFKGAERCQLMSHVHTGFDAASDSGAALGGRWLIQNMAKCLACDASLVVIEEDDVGNVLNIARRSRTIPVAMSRALSIRDGSHCQFPGCCESRYIDGHHIQHWADGGETKLGNLVTLCRFHHRELHKGSFSLSVKSNKENLRYVYYYCKK